MYSNMGIKRIVSIRTLDLWNYKWKLTLIFEQKGQKTKISLFFLYKFYFLLCKFKNKRAGEIYIEMLDGTNQGHWPSQPSMGVTRGGRQGGAMPPLESELSFICIGFSSINDIRARGCPPWKIFWSHPCSQAKTKTGAALGYLVLKSEEVYILQKKWEDPPPPMER